MRVRKRNLIQEDFVAMTENQQYHASIDVAKFIAAILVVAIHVPPFESNTLGSWITDRVARLAVPLFFSISGALFFGKIRFTNGKIARCQENVRRLQKYLKRLLKIYLLWSAIYCIYHLPNWYHTGWWGLTMIKDVVASLLFTGIHYHLWYLLALPVATAALYLLLYVFGVKPTAFVSVALWLFFCTGCIFPELSLFQLPIIEWGTTRFSAWYMAVFCGLPLMFGGYLCTVPARIKQGRVLLLLGTACLYWGESIILHSFVLHADLSYVFSAPLLVAEIMNNLISVPLPSTKYTVALRNVSEYTYLFHPLVGALLADRILWGNTAYFLLTTLCTILISYGAVRLQAAERKNTLQ